MITYIIPFIILILVVVFIHEYGHYYFARRYGVGVTDFSIGFGKEIIGWNDKYGTRWKICWIPLGGYVKFFGDRNVFSQADQEKILKQYNKNDQEKRAREALEMVDLAGFEKKFPWQLSGGMQQRVSIARALTFHPDLLLMDEPFGALDEIVRDQLNEHFHRLWEQTQKTVVFVTHSIPEAAYLSPKIVVMSPRPGKIIEVIESTLPDKRTLDIRETKEFLELSQRIRRGLRAGHSYD